MRNEIFVQELISGHADLLSEMMGSRNSDLSQRKQILFISDLPLEMYLTILKPWTAIVGLPIEFKVMHPSHYLENMEILDIHETITIFLLGNSKNFELFFSKFRKPDMQSEIFLVCPKQQNSISNSLTKTAHFPNLKYIQVESLEVKDIYESNVSLQELTLTTHAILNVLERTAKPRYTKLLMIDLDNTLYSGEISEGRSSDIFFNDTHLAAIDFYTSLSKQGIFIEVLTRNPPSVLEDLKLHPAFNEFAKIVSNFNFVQDSKGRMLKERISFYNFLEDSVTVIDDNPAELIDILQHNPRVRTLRPLPDGSNWKIMSFHIYANSNHEYDEQNDFRYKDLEANSKRSKLDSSLSKSELHSTLKTHLRLEIVNPREDIAKIQRCISLSQRTNQFNLMNRRIDSSNLNQLFSSGYDFITCQLKDAFGDSGIIFFAVVKAKNIHAVEIYELCISCRALGRHIESLMVSEAIAFWSARKLQDTKRVELEFVPTNKNSVANEWLKSIGYDAFIDFSSLKNSKDVELLKDVVLIEWV